jgi:hypothetical protein
MDAVFGTGTPLPAILKQLDALVAARLPLRSCRS